MDDQVIKDFETRLKMFDTSLTNVAKDLLGKLDNLAKETATIAESTSYLKSLKVNLDEQNKRLETMDSTLEELLKRLETISEQPMDLKGKKKKKKK